MEGIKSKDRVKEHGEVFTPDSIVGDMLDLVDNDAKETGEAPEVYIMKTYFEPACGNGNFLIRILDRKLAVVRMMAEVEQEEWLVKAVSSIYGVDIQEDNVMESIERMMKLIENGEVDVLELKDKTPRGFACGGGFKLSDDTKQIIRFIMSKNIILGNSLETDPEEEVKLINWGFEGSSVEPKMFSLSDIDNDVSLDNERTNWRNLMDLNYSMDTSTLGMEF